MFKKELRLRWVKSHCELMSLPEVAPLLSVENSIQNGKNFHKLIKFISYRISLKNLS